MIRNLLKKAKFVALIPIFTLPLQVNAARNYENTWFEIEVILFSQVGDKSQLQEAFPESSAIVAPNAVIDLLGPYLEPNIASLKDRLPTCSAYIKNKDSSPLNQTFEIKYPAIEKQYTLATSYGASLTDFLKVELVKDNVNKTDLPEVNSIQSTFENNINTSEENLITNTSTNNTINNDTLGINETSDDNFEQLTHSNQNNDLVFTQVSIPQEICKTPESFFTEYKKENPSFFYNGAPPENIPTSITGEEDFTTIKPYLINEESLQLQDIVKQLKRSRNFRPLLHLGWRQLTKGPKEAIPLKLYAGENLIQPYNKALSSYNLATQKALEAKQLNELLTEQNQINQINQIFENEQLEINNKQENNALINQISDILKNAKHIQPELDSLLDELNSGPVELVTPVENALNSNIETPVEQQLVEPIKPPQNWTIEGLLKVEVEHFLHITADFNVINMSLAEQATNQLTPETAKPLQSIRFEQNKRVRSKEIHYFDHPYMGMIVQIRRHKQIPPVEEVENVELVNQ